MGRLTLQDKVPTLICLALMVMHSVSELQSFSQSEALSWDEARNYCKRCFVELVTLTPDIIHTIAPGLSSDHWIGLRKKLPPSSVPWSHWANGDPLVFQNWYPGQPLLDSTSPDYIEDSCAAMLSFGTWVEKNCTEPLPFICCEDRFFGKGTVTSFTNSNASLKWQSVPGVSHYRVEVKGDKERTANQTGLTHDLIGLTAGTRYSVQVFPVKCERDLNPLNITFYTKPNKVRNLTVTRVTETSVYLNWRKPAGNVDFYLVKVGSREIHSKTEGKEVDALIPGSLYMFSVRSGVQDYSTWSDENISVFTKPGKVSNLKASNNTNDSVLVSWTPPDGNFSGFRVNAMNSRNDMLFEEVVSKASYEVTATGLPTATKITLNVTTLNTHAVEGDSVTIFTYTAPGLISHLTVVSEHYSLNVTWDPFMDKDTSFTAQLLLGGEVVETVKGLTEPRKQFDGLKTAALYTVKVFAISGDIEGPAEECSTYTRPVPPTDARAISVGRNTITLKWTAPESIENPTYFVHINSVFWSHSWSFNVFNKTEHTFSELKSGTKYQIEVFTVAGDLKSSVATSYTAYTVADEREISLSMLCSSEESLLCDNTTTRESVFNQLDAHFHNLLGDHVVWKLEKQQSENTGA